VTGRRRALAAVTLAALLGASACGRATAGSAGASSAPSTTTASATTPSTTTTTASDVTPGPGTLLPVPSMPRPRPIGVGAAGPTTTAPPVEVDIPAIGVASSLEDLHLQSDGTIAAPVDYAKAGWFADGVFPGAPGPAIIAGHVDSHTNGPEVFYRLRELRPDDLVVVTRADGTAASFRITNVEQYAKDDFPVGLVYGPTPGPALRLVTCGGQFDRNAGHYRSNTVAFAVLAD
jgi:Sortase domain